jgi:hypothetical protein
VIRRDVGVHRTRVELIISFLKLTQNVIAESFQFWIGPHSLRNL